MNRARVVAAYQQAAQLVIDDREERINRGVANIMRDPRRIVNSITGMLPLNEARLSRLLASAAVCGPTAGMAKQFHDMAKAMIRRHVELNTPVRDADDIADDIRSEQ